MAKISSKNELLNQAKIEAKKLEAALKPLSPDQLTEAGACDDWSVKDILAHLLEWQQMVIRWYQAGERGEVPKTPADDLKWSQTPLLNQRIYEQYREMPLAEVQKRFAASTAEIMQLMEAIPDEKLLTAGAYPWTGKVPLASYFNSATASHYRWASGLIRRWAKNH